MLFLFCLKITTTKTDHKKGVVQALNIQLSNYEKKIKKRNVNTKKRHTNKS